MKDSEIKEAAAERKTSLLSKINQKEYKHI
jgi:hypothetical protein